MNLNMKFNIIFGHNGFNFYNIDHLNEKVALNNTFWVIDSINRFNRDG